MCDEGLRLQGRGKRYGQGRDHKGEGAALQAEGLDPAKCMVYEPDVWGGCGDDSDTVSASSLTCTQVRSYTDENVCAARSGRFQPPAAGSYEFNLSLCRQLDPPTSMRLSCCNTHDSGHCMLLLPAIGKLTSRQLQCCKGRPCITVIDIMHSCICNFTQLLHLIEKTAKYNEELRIHTTYR